MNNSHFIRNMIAAATLIFLIAGFAFSLGVNASDISHNAAEIGELRQVVKEIPALKIQLAEMNAKLDVLLSEKKGAKR